MRQRGVRMEVATTTVALARCAWATGSFASSRMSARATVGRCSAAQLSVALVRAGAAAGNVGGYIGFINRSETYIRGEAP